MKTVLLMTLFTLATLAWAAAQQPGSTPDRNSGQATPPSSQAPSAGQAQPSTPGSADQAGSQGQASNAPVTEFAPVRPRLPMSEISTEAVISAMDSLLPRRAAAHSS